MPSEVGLSWTYRVRTGFGAEHVEDARIVREVTVAGTKGFEVAGPLGAARFAWKRGVLWAERFANVSCNPPLPLLQVEAHPLNWEGVLRSAAGGEKSTAKLGGYRDELLKIGGRSFETLRAELHLLRPGGETTITTWFAEGVGVVRQDQRTAGALDVRVEWVAGPVQKRRS